MKNYRKAILFCKIWDFTLKFLKIRKGGYILFLSILYGTLMLFSIVTSLFCCTSKDNSNHTIKDNDLASEWINRVRTPSSSIEIFHGEEIAFSIIPDNQKSEYISRLEHTQYVELEKNEYLKLTKKNLDRKYGFAIRAVYTHSGGNFDVLKNNENEYYVHYMVMGSRVWEYNKAVLIIEADELPKEIFNGYTVVK